MGLLYLILSQLPTARGDNANMSTNVGEATIALKFDNKSVDKSLDKTGSKISRAFGNVAKTAAKVTMAATAAAGASMAALGKASVSAVADYQQMVGGVETLFKSSAKTVEKYADQAYKTAGLSANAYMEQATNFSASLLQSLGGDTKKAAESANQAIIDMADNSNKMGTDIQRIQDAYQGFAKQNYMMLDNLKLGYGGTKTEMERLLKDAEKLSGHKYDIGNLNDVFEAIHVVQKELGITGTTAKEAESTITGAANSAKSAWTNFLTALGTGQDVSGAFDKLAQSVGTLMKNIVPVVTQIVKSAFELLPQIFADVMNEMKNSGVPVLESLGQVMQSVGDAFNQIAPSVQQYLSALGPYISQIFNTLSQLASAILPAIAPIISAIFTISAQAMPVVQQILAAITPTLVQIVQLLTPIITKVTEIITKITGALMPVISSIVGLVSGVVTAVMAVVSPVVSFISNNVLSPILDFVGGAVSAISGLVNGLVEGIKASVKPVAQVVNITVIEPVKNLFKGLKESVGGMIEALVGLVTGDFSKMKSGAQKSIGGITGIFTGMVTGAGRAVGTLVGSFTQVFGKILAKVGEFAIKIVNAFKEIPGKMVEVGKNIVEGLWNGIGNMAGWVGEKIKGFGEGVLNGIKDFFGIHSPSRVMRDQVGKMIVRGLNEGVKAESKSAVSTVKALSKSLMAALKTDNGDYSAVGSDLISRFSSGMNKAVSGMKTKIETIVKSAVSTLKSKFASQKSVISEVYSTFGKDVIRGFTEKMNTVTSNLVNKTSEKIQGLLSEMQGAVSEVENKISNMYNASITQPLYEKITAANGAEKIVLTNMQEATKQTMQYYDNLLQLQSKVPDDLIQKIVGMDMSTAMAYTNELLSLSSEALEEYVSGYEERAKVAEMLSKQFYQSEIDSIKTDFTDKVKKELKSTQKEIQKIGQQTMEGYIKGLKATDYSGEVQKIAKSIIKSMKKALGIASPSKVFAEIGDFSAQGYVEGFAEGMSLPEVELRSTAVGAFSGGNGGPGVIGGITVNMTNQINNEMDAEDIGRRLMTSIRRATL